MTITLHFERLTRLPQDGDRVHYREIVGRGLGSDRAYIGRLAVQSDAFDGAVPPETFMLQITFH